MIILEAKILPESCCSCCWLCWWWNVTQPNYYFSI